MLTEIQINKNKEKYISLIKSITIEGAKINSFLSWLEGSDFFLAPASSKYHCSYKGGLCEHSLNVYDALVKLVKQFGVENQYSDDTLKMVSLLHDISKTNFYEVYEKNVNTGEKDINGKDIWIKVPEYKTKDCTNRFIYGSHEQNSEYIAHTFFPLSTEESSAILHHHGGMSWDSSKDDISAVYEKFNLALLLHMADMLSTYLYERRYE